MKKKYTRSQDSGRNTAPAGHCRGGQGPCAQVGDLGTEYFFWSFAVRVVCIGLGLFKTQQEMKGNFQKSLVGSQELGFGEKGGKEASISLVLLQDPDGLLGLTSDMKSFLSG